MAEVPRVAWDSCSIIDYLKGADRARECSRIIEAAERGELEIVVSTLAEAEVARVGEPPLPEEQEAMIKEFFDREYVKRYGLDQRVAAQARAIVRTYGLKPADAVHVATALLAPGVHALESYDDRDMDRIRNSSVPLPRALIIRQPTYEGQASADDLLRDREAGGNV